MLKFVTLRREGVENVQFLRYVINGRRLFETVKITSFSAKMLFANLLINVEILDYHTCMVCIIFNV